MKLLGALILTLAATIATAGPTLSPEDTATLEALKSMCGATRFIGSPLPANFADMPTRALIGCVARFGMKAPCLASMTTIKMKDGTYKFNAMCAPIPLPEEAQPQGQLRIH